VEPSKSFAAELLAYARERLLAPRILVLGGAVAACAAVASRAQHPELTAPLAFLMVWQFRLWDDLEDLGFDRVLHPGRVLVLSAAPRAFGAAVIASVLAVGTALALTAGVGRALTYAVLAAVVASGYRLLRKAPQRRLLRTHWVLAKYPAFVFLAAWQPVIGRAVLVAALVYLVLCLIEIADDPGLRGMREARALAVAEGIAIAGIIVYGAFL
jgi:hypothetical protein